LARSSALNCRKCSSNLGDTLHHVLNVRAHSLHCCQLFSDAEPFLDKQLLLADLLDVDAHVPEITSQRATRPSHNHLAGFDGNFDCSTPILSYIVYYSQFNHNRLLHSRLCWLLAQYCLCQDCLHPALKTEAMLLSRKFGTAYWC